MTTRSSGLAVRTSLVHTDLGTRSATISSCGRYRYALERSTGIAGPNLAWLMLNPSTADASQDDPTIRKVVGFTRRAGYGVALVVNLFGWRATNPRDCLANLADAEGEGNYAAIMKAAEISEAVVCAWGAHPWAREQAGRVLYWLDEHPRAQAIRLLCLGTSKDGDPLHPLMPSYDGHPLVPFIRRAPSGAFGSAFDRKRVGALEAALKRLLEPCSVMGCAEPATEEGYAYGYWRRTCSAHSATRRALPDVFTFWRPHERNAQIFAALRGDTTND